MARRLVTTLPVLLAAASALASDPAPSEHVVLPKAVVGVVPFEEQGESNRVYLNLAPESNRPLVWLLDTGAQDNVMTPLAARAAGVSVRRTKSTPYVRKTRLGSSVRFWVDTRSSDTGSKTGWEYGLLGGEFLEEYVVEIDFTRRVVRFLDPKRYEVPKTVGAEDERVIPMRVRGKRPFVEVELGERPGQVLLDTGAPCNLVLSGSAAKKMGIDWKSLPEFGRYGSTLGPVDVRLLESDLFRFAGFRFGTMPVMVAPKGWYNMGGNTDSVVGYDVLRQFVVRLDYPRERMWLKRTGDPEVTYLGVEYALTRRIGVFMSSTVDGYVVLRVSPDTPAARIGLRPGDRPVNPAGEDPLDLADFIGRVESGEEITVTRQQGKVWVDTILPEAELD
jgi:predicted aspartyl protease